MQHTDSSVEYTVVLDGDVTVGLFVGYWKQRNDIHCGAKGRKMQHTDSSIEYTVVLDGEVNVGLFGGYWKHSGMTYTVGRRAGTWSIFSGMGTQVFDTTQCRAMA